MNKKVIFVFPIRVDGTVLLHEGTYPGPTQGQYIPPHKSTSLDSDYTLSELGYDALNSHRIMGRIRASPRHVLPYERGELHYLVADVRSYGAPYLRQFSPEQITDFGRNNIAPWVPEVMRVIGLISSVEMLKEKQRRRPIRLLTYRSARSIVGTQYSSRRCFSLGFQQSRLIK